LIAGDNSFRMAKSSTAKDEERGKKETKEHTYRMTAIKLTLCWYLNSTELKQTAS